MPNVSVILPTCNRSARLREAVASIQAQTVTDWELLIVDDGSTDETPQAARELCDGDARIHCLRQNNRGGAAARNAGIRAARGALIAFLDDDDAWVPGKLAAQCRLLDQERGLGWVYSHLAIHNHDTGITETRGRSVTSFRELFRGRFIGLQTMVVQHSVIERAGLLNEDPAIWGAEDLEWCLRLAKVAPFRCVPEPLTIRNLFAEHGTLERQARYLEGLIRMYRQLDLSGQQEVTALDRTRKVADLHHHAACFYREHGAYRQAASHFGRALLTYPPIGLYLSTGSRTWQQQLRQVLAPLVQGAACLLKASKNGLVIRHNT
ncbi:MAG: glycosyltransferase family 2 protein [Candidatus Omnitrophica bacterium]|nr:glycosyltransferase family 2 protein [Candidatus Omnitrophota bacterium]